MDSIQGWVLDKLCFGPLKPEEMPFEGYTVNPIVVKIKPSGAARVCINMSAPYQKPWHQADAPSAVNSGVNKTEFPACMGSTKSFAIVRPRSTRTPTGSDQNPIKVLFETD